MSQELELSEQLMNEGFTPFGEIEELTEEQILDDKIFQFLFTLEPEQRIKILVRLRERARKLKIGVKSFNEMLKLYQAKYTQTVKQQGSKIINFTDAPLEKLKCGEWICEDGGVYRWVTNNYTPVKIIACPHPIMPMERLINVDTNIEKIKLAFYKDKKWQNVVVEKNTVASKSKIIQLANTGVEVNENNAKELITFLADVINLNTQEIPVNKGITHLGWIENEFVPYTSEFKYDGEDSFKNIYKNVREKGDYKIWKEEIGRIREKSKTMHFIIASSFASPLIELLQINPFIVHLWGKSSTGKTVALMIAMSIWGNPRVGQLVSNLNSTNVGFERLSAFLKNIPFAGDELQSIKNRFTDFNELIYRLTQGEGKTRGTINGGVEEKLKWNCAFLTTGEEPITSDFSKEGVKNRVIEIEENKKIVENGNQVVNIITENYGHAGKEFIQKLPNVEILKQKHSELCQKIKKENVTSEKQINAIATVLLADKIVSKEIFNGNALEISEIKEYFSKDVDEADRIYNLIIDWFYQNINKFYFDSMISTGEIWGSYEKQREEVTNIYVIPKVLREFLSNNNISFDGIKNKLFNEGYIEKNTNSNRKMYTFSKRINGTVCSCIKINVQPEKSDIAFENEYKQQEMEELPF